LKFPHSADSSRQISAGRAGGDAIAIETAQSIGEWRKETSPIPAAVDYQPPTKPAPARSLKKAVKELERQMIVDALDETRNNRQQDSRLLGLSRQRPIDKIKRYAITGAGR
jgi:DNA-binding NtrC family response regulator